VCGPGARFFESIEQLSEQMNLLESDSQVREEMRRASTQRHSDLFQPEMILSAYEQLMKGLPVDDSRWLLS
jgi:hypothetical protein